MSRLTIRQRLTIWFTLGFIALGLLVRGIVFWRLDRRLDSVTDPARIGALDEITLPDGRTVPDPGSLTTADGRTLREIVEATSDQFRTDTLDELAIWSGVAVIIMAVLATAVGWWLSGRALSPIGRIIGTAQAVSAQSLDRRIDHVGPDDELAALATTIDEMLDRIETGVAAQRQFAAMASHELKTPLAVIDLESSMAVADPDATTVTALAERTGSAARRAAKLVDQLLALSRSQAGVIDVSEIDLSDICAQSLADHLAAADDAGVRVDFEPRQAIVDGDPALLVALVDNLVDNAIKHNHRHGFVRVEVSTVGSKAELVVENSGPTLDTETIERIAQPFQRNVDNPDNLGHGMGMTIIRTIVDRHGGTFELHPREAGGMRIVVILPTG